MVVTRGIAAGETATIAAPVAVFPINEAKRNRRPAEARSKAVCQHISLIVHFRGPYRQPMLTKAAPF